MFDVCRERAQEPGVRNRLHLVGGHAHVRVVQAGRADHDLFHSIEHLLTLDVKRATLVRVHASAEVPEELSATFERWCARCLRRADPP